MRVQEVHESARLVCGMADREDLGLGFHTLIVPPTHP
jgi:hypothetical protein